MAGCEQQHLRPKDPQPRSGRRDAAVRPAEKLSTVAAETEMQPWIAPPKIAGQQFGKSVVFSFAVRDRLPPAAGPATLYDPVVLTGPARNR